MSDHEVHSACRSCRADVIFVPSAKTGKTMILDATPKKGVVCGSVDWDAGRVKIGTFDKGDTAMVVDVYTDHHATCPNADDWKGRTRNDPDPALD